MEEGKYPDWRRIMDQTPENWVTVRTGELTRAIKMAQLAAGPTDRVKLTFSGMDLEISSGGSEGSAAGHVDVGNYNGPEITFYFGAEKLLGGLSGDLSELAFTSPLKPMFIRNSGGHLSMIQPRRNMEEEDAV